MSEPNATPQLANADSDALAETVPGYRAAVAATALERTPKSDAPPSVGDSVLGTIIGDFRIDEVIASGGMGTVYKATQLHPMRRVVALKMIRAGVTNESTLLRFHRERQALAHLNHPDIAHIFEAGTTRDGQPYFVMEFCDGQPIDEYCKDRRLSQEARLRLIQRVTKAVSEAHREGVIHRDLKPSNILVADGEHEPIVRVIDFGIAKFTDEDVPEANDNATRVGEFIGTPAYMAPEQALSSNVDARADVFSIGAVLFKLLTGTTPLDLCNESDVCLATIIERLRHFETDTPGHRLATLSKAHREVHANDLGFATPRNLIQSLRRELDWIAIKALASNRTDRYATVEDFAADLTAYLEHRPVTAVAPSLSYRFKKLYQRRKAAVLATLICSLATLTTTGVVAVSWWEVQQERQAELRILETELHVLLRLAHHASERAVHHGPHSKTNFGDAEEALNAARQLIQSEPALSEFDPTLRHAIARLRADQQCLKE